MKKARSLKRENKIAQVRKQGRSGDVHLMVVWLFGDIHEYFGYKYTYMCVSVCVMVMMMMMRCKLHVIV